MGGPICVVGVNYVGLVYAAGLAQLGWTVRLCDPAEAPTERLRRGIFPFRDPGLAQSLRRYLKDGRVVVCASIEMAAEAATIVFVCTEASARKDGSSDVAPVRAVLEIVAEVGFDAWPTIALVSSLPPGTSDALKPLIAHRAELIYAPEFLLEGTGLRDFFESDRMVVGCESAAAAVPFVALFERLQKPVVFVSRCDAEMIKCASNAFLAMKTSFANEIAHLCGAVGATPDDVLRGIGYDRRIGPDYLRVGIGYGGPGLERDVRAIESLADRHGTRSELFAATMRTNQAQIGRIVALLESELGSLAGATIGVWGLANKAATSESLAIRVVEEIGRRGAYAIAYDPAVHVAPLRADRRIAASPLEATEADALLVLTDWREFAEIDPRLYAAALRRGVVIDARNLLDAERVAAAGLKYHGVGRSVSPAPRALAAQSP